MFTKNENKEIMNKLDKLLQNFAKENGVSISRGGSTYGLEVATRITINKITETEYGMFPETKESKEFLKRCEGMGLSEDVLFEELNTVQGKLRVMGYNKRASKKPMEFTLDDKPYKSGVAFIKDLVLKARPELGI